MYIDTLQLQSKCIYIHYSYIPNVYIYITVTFQMYIDTLQLHSKCILIHLQLHFLCTASNYCSGLFVFSYNICMFILIHILLTLTETYYLEFQLIY